ncbi:MAG TPA: restriction endonuclease subunit S [Gammaproteobacteria bacterium]|nr:restriction endonuclease subunit S [Gammaproteobacteria bacterium]
MSVLAWIDTLPRDWKAKPLRSTVDYVVSNVDKVPADDEIPVRLCNYTDVYNNEFITLALEFMQATATEEEIAKFGLRVDDVAITKDSESWDDIGVPALVRETASDLVCGYHLALLRPHKQQMDGAFLFRCLQAKPVRVQLELAANGVTRFGIPKSEIGAMTLPVPPLPQQRAIADYLDRETARLDALMAAKERVLELLAEKRRALITRAVTRGLDPRAPLRDSDIPWLGEIPAHWQSMRLRFLVRHLEQGWSPEAENREPGDEEWGVLKLNAVSRGRFNQSAAKALPPDFAIRADLEVHRGDFLVTRSNTPSLVGDACFVEEARPHLMLCDLTYRLTLREEVIDGKFLGHFLTLPEGRGQIESDARGTSGSMVKISQEHIKDWWIPLPPLGEQVELVAHIGRETGALDEMFTATERTIDLLKERRAALIAAAVTGQIDVRAA